MAPRPSASTRSGSAPTTRAFEHDEVDTGHDEVYVVLDGAGRAVVDGDELALAEGDYLLVDAVSTRQIIAGADGLRFVAVAGKPQPEYDGRPAL